MPRNQTGKANTKTPRPPTFASIRRKVLSILYKAIGPIDAKTRNDLLGMDVETLTTCTGLVLRAKSVALQEFRDTMRKPKCEQKTHDRRATRCRGKEHN